MGILGMRGAVCAAAIAFVSTTVVQAQSAPPVAAAASVWALRAGLNVAALSCRGPDEVAIVAGYNRLLADHRAELADTYRAVALEHGTAAAMDDAMTRLYNEFAQPAAQATLCANALGVLDAAVADGGPLALFAGPALDRLEGRAQPAVGGVVAQVAVAAIPQIVDTRAPEVEGGIPDAE